MSRRVCDAHLHDDIVLLEHGRGGRERVDLDHQHAGAVLRDGQVGSLCASVEFKESSGAIGRIGDPEKLMDQQ